MPATPRVTLIVPTYKREQPLVTTLQCLAAADYPRQQLDVVVVDQTPEHEPATRRFLEEEEAAGRIRWFRPPTVTFASLTKARNYGIAEARQPEIIIFVDDDVEFAPDFIRHHVAAYADDSVMAVAGRITVPGHRYPAGEPAEVSRVTWWGGFVNNFYGTTARPSKGFVGCNFSIRASVLEQTGGFEERFIGNAMREETDLAVRICQVGGVIRFVPGAYLLHHMVPGGGTRSDARLAWYYSFFHNHFLFYGKYAARWRVPFFVVHQIRPLLACWLWYGKGSWKGFSTPWRGIAAGLRAAAEARRAGTTVVKTPKYRVF